MWRIAHLVLDVAHTVKQCSALCLLAVEDKSITSIYKIRAKPFDRTCRIHATPRSLRYAMIVTTLIHKSMALRSHSNTNVVRGNRLNIFLDDMDHCRYQISRAVIYSRNLHAQG